MTIAHAVASALALGLAIGCSGAQPPATTATNERPPASASNAPSAASQGPEATQPAEPAPSAEPAPATDSPEAPRDVEQASFKQANYTLSKKIYLNDISCRTAEKGKLEGLAGLAAVGSGLVKKHAELKACFDPSVKLRVRWMAAGAKMTKVQAGGSDAKVSKCLQAALENAPTELPDAECAVTVWHD